MAKVPKPHNFDEIKKRGSTDKHIAKRVADTASAGKLDSNIEDDILEAWVKSIKPDDSTQFQPYKKRYPAIGNNRLRDYILVYKEVELDGYRIDSIIRHPENTWELVEVKSEAGLNPGVIGHLLSKGAQFKDIFIVNPENVEMTILAGGHNESFQAVVNLVNDQYCMDIGFEEIDI